MATIPSWVLKDMYWKGVIHLFKNSAMLNSVFNTKYFDLENGDIKVTALKRVSVGWSQSEKCMLNLAFHLFNETNKVNLSDMDFLDDYN